MTLWNILEKYGPDTPSWKWKVHRWEQGWRARKQHWAERKDHVRYPHKFCPRCGALVAREDKKCSQCGARAGSWHLQALSRAWGAFMPRNLAVTPVILWINGVVLLLGIFLFGPDTLFHPTGRSLAALGALIPRLVVAADEHWRLITHAYLHIGAIHILFNMWVLTQLGPVVEREIGSARFFVVYTMAVIAGGAANLVMFPGQIMYVAGASGALFGLIGFGLAYSHFTGSMGGRMARDLFLRWAFFGFIFGLLVPNISNTTHAGGFIAGALMGWLLSIEYGNEQKFTNIWRILAAICLALTVLSFLSLAGAQALEAMQR